MWVCVLFDRQTWTLKDVLQPLYYGLLQSMKTVVYFREIKILNYPPNVPYM